MSDIRHENVVDVRRKENTSRDNADQMERAEGQTLRLHGQMESAEGQTLRLHGGRRNTVLSTQRLQRHCSEPDVFTGNNGDIEAPRDRRQWKPPPHAEGLRRHGSEPNVLAGNFASLTSRNEEAHHAQHARLQQRLAANRARRMSRTRSGHNNGVPGASWGGEAAGPRVDSSEL